MEILDFKPQDGGRKTIIFGLESVLLQVDAVRAGEEITLQTIERPGAVNLLESLQEHFEIILYSTYNKEYTANVLEQVP